MNAVVVGAGSWGTAFARVLADRGHAVTLAARDAGHARAIAETGRNPRYQSQVDLGDVATTTTDALPQEADLYVVAVPSRAFGETVRHLPDGAPVLSLTKGLDPETGERLSTLVRGRPVAVLSGPNMAEEVTAGLPTAAALASEDLALAERLQGEINSVAFRVYVNADLVGVELCAAAKNVMAIATGMAEGLGLGYNPRAALITRGLAEMTRLGVALGADPLTFAGLAGMGDLVLTCTGALSRNRQLGLEIGQGRRLDESLASRETVAEGVYTTQSAHALASREEIEMPIVAAVYRILFEGRDPRRAIGELMTRELRAEPE